MVTLVDELVKDRWEKEFDAGTDKNYPNIDLVRLEKWFFNSKPGKLIEYGFSLLNRETGRLYFTSHPTSGEKIKIDPHELITGKKIEGSWGGETDLSKQILEMHKLFSKSKINLNLLLKKTYKLEEINKVFYDLKFGNVARPIIKMKH